MSTTLDENVCDPETLENEAGMLFCQLSYVPPLFDFCLMLPSS